jgi:hypothetical protein
MLQFWEKSWTVVLGTTACRPIHPHDLVTRASALLDDIDRRKEVCLRGEARTSIEVNLPMGRDDLPPLGTRMGCALRGYILLGAGLWPKQNGSRKAAGGSSSLTVQYA